VGYIHINLKKNGCIGQTVTTENINNNKKLKFES